MRTIILVLFVLITKMFYGQNVNIEWGTAKEAESPIGGTFLGIYKGVVYLGSFGGIEKYDEKTNTLISATKFTFSSKEKEFALLQLQNAVFLVDGEIVLITVTLEDNKQKKFIPIIRLIQMV